MRFSRTLSALIAILLLGSAACSDDDGSVLSNAERDWCTFTDTDEENAGRFDLIFEKGISIGLQMDSINAQASGRLTELTDSGMSTEEAVRKVSEELLQDADYVVACKAAFAEYGG